MAPSSPLSEPILSRSSASESHENACGGSRRAIDAARLEAFGCPGDACGARRAGEEFWLVFQLSWATSPSFVSVLGVRTRPNCVIKTSSEQAQELAKKGKPHAASREAAQTRNWVQTRGKSDKLSRESSLVSKRNGCALALSVPESTHRYLRAPST